MTWLLASLRSWATSPKLRIWAMIASPLSVDFPVAVELGRAERGAGFALARRLEPSSVEHPAAEGGLVERRAEDRLVHVLQSAQGEELGQQGERDVRIIELAAQPPHREAEHL